MTPRWRPLLLPEANFILFSERKCIRYGYKCRLQTKLCYNFLRQCFSVQFTRKKITGNSFLITIYLGFKLNPVAVAVSVHVSSQNFRRISIVMVVISAGFMHAQTTSFNLASGTGIARTVSTPGQRMRTFSTSHGKYLIVPMEIWSVILLFKTTFPSDRMYPRKENINDFL